MSDERATPAGDDAAPGRPLLRVVRGEPTAEELAALVAVVTARAAAAAEATGEPAPTSAWADRTALVRKAVPHGAGAWRASAWPR